MPKQTPQYTIRCGQTIEKRLICPPLGEVSGGQLQAKRAKYVNLLCLYTIPQKSMKFKLFLMEYVIFVNYDNIYVNIVMLTLSTNFAYKPKQSQILVGFVARDTRC